MDLTDAIKHILNGDGLLFLGAGFSKGAVNIKNDELGDACEFSKFLCEEMSIGLETDLGAVSGYYLQSALNERELLKRKKNLINNIQNLFITNGVEDFHKVIANLPWRRIYTTNYDDVIEFSHDDSLSSYTLNSETTDILDRKSVVHLNGYARSVGIEELDNEFKLTTRSYLADDFLKSKSKVAFDTDVRKPQEKLPEDFFDLDVNYFLAF